jgi:para-aminobenzoate synthetase component 1
LYVLQKLIKKNSENGFNINIEAINKCFDRVCILDSNTGSNSKKYLQSSKIIAIGATQELMINNSKNALEELQQFCDAKKRWLFGYLSYDLKNQTENLVSENEDSLAFPLLHFFCPKVVIQFSEDTATIFYDDDFLSKNEAEEIYNLSTTFTISEERSGAPSIKVESKITKQEYIDSVNRLKQHIRKGDIYEVNFCQEFFAKNAQLNPVDVYEKLNKISEAPFTAYGKFGKHFLMCASPERFLQKRGNRIISQPIKGTIKRSENKLKDEELKTELYNSTKERSENVMIVDLVRNDLSRIAKSGSINVDELFGIYSFKQLHQMISTVSCELKEGILFKDILKSTFPMGSMTGAPKVNAMKLIEQYENTKRGLYSGAVGYISPDGDFDFNVVIRSILYNAENNYLSFMVGSAITDKANAEQEYEECLLKAKAMFEVLQSH